MSKIETRPLVASAGPVTSMIDGWLAWGCARGGGGGGIWQRRASLTSFHAPKLLICALGGVPGGYDWWYVATGLAMAVGSGHSSHSSDLAMVTDRGRGKRICQ